MSFSKHLILDEMFVHKMVQKPDQFLAFRGHIWLLNKFMSVDKVKEIERVIKAEHPQSGTFDQNNLVSWDNLSDWVQAHVSDAFMGYWDQAKKTIWTSHEFGTNPITAPLVRRVAQTLGVRKVSYEDTQFIGGDHVERKIDYRMKDMLARLPEEMFHGTCTKYLPAILKFGLRPGVSDSNWSDQNIHHDDRIFLAARLEDAEYHAGETSRKKNSKPLIIKVSVPDKAKIQPDFDADTVATGDQTYYHDPKDMPNLMTRSSVDATKSSRNAGVVAYTGRIPSAFITAVYLFMAGKWKSVRLDTLKRRCEEDPWDWAMYYGLM